MDTTEQCNAVISHFNGKFIKMAPGALGRKLWRLKGESGGGGLTLFFSLQLNCQKAGNDYALSNK